MSSNNNNNEEEFERLAIAEYAKTRKKLLGKKNYRQAKNNFTQEEIDSAVQEHQNWINNRENFIRDKIQEFRQAGVARQPTQNLSRGQEPRQELSPEQIQMLSEERSRQNETNNLAIKTVNKLANDVKEIAFKDQEQSDRFQETVITKKAPPIGSCQPTASTRVSSAVVSGRQKKSASTNRTNRAPASKKPPAATPRTTRKTTGKSAKSTKARVCAGPSPPSPQFLEALKEGSNKIAYSTHRMATVPAKLEDTVVKTYCDNESRARIGVQIQSYHKKWDFGHLASVVKSHIREFPDKKHEYLLLESNNTITHAGQPVDFPVLLLIIVPEGTKLPHIVQDGYTGIFYTLDELRLGQKRVNDLVKNYRAIEKEDPVALVDEYLEGRLSVITGAGPTYRGSTMDGSDVSRYEQLRLIDCRPDKTFKDRHLTGGTTRKCAFSFEIDGQWYKYLKDSAESIDDVVDEAVSDPKGPEDSVENRAIIEHDLRGTLESKNESIVKVLEILRCKCRSLQDFNEIKLGLIGPSNLNEVTMDAAWQLFMTEAYQDFVRKKFGDECDIVQLARRDPKDVLAEDDLTPDSLLDRFIAHRSEDALMCLSDDLSKHAERLPDYDYGNDEDDPPAEFSLESVIRRTADGDIDAELTWSTAHAFAERFLMAKKNRHHVTMGEKVALEEFAHVCSKGVDPATIEFSVDQLKERILSPYRLEPENHTYMAPGAAYGPPINIDGGAIWIKDGLQQEVEQARQS